MHANWEASLLAIPVSVEDAFLADRSPFISHRGTQHRCVVGSSMTYTMSSNEMSSCSLSLHPHPRNVFGE